MSSRVAPARCAQRRLGCALLLGAGGAARTRHRAPGAVHVVGCVRRNCASSSLRSAGRSEGSYRVLVDANQHVDREAAARSGVGFYGKNTMLITRNARVLGRARDARQRSRARVDAAARHRLRRLQDLHRRVPDRRARRAGHPRRDEVPVLLDAGADVDSRGISAAARRTGVRLRHLPGRLPLEPRRGETPRPTALRPQSGTSISSSGSSPKRSSATTTACTCRGTTRNSCAATRSLRSATSAAPSTSTCSNSIPPTSTHAGRSNRSRGAPGCAAPSSLR